MQSRVFAQGRAWHVTPLYYTQQRGTRKVILVGRVVLAAWHSTGGSVLHLHRHGCVGSEGKGSAGIED